MSKMTSQTYVISLPTSEQRRAHIQCEFSKQGIEFEFFDAFYPSEILDKQVADLLPNLAHTWLSGGEQGCFMSHLTLWKKCIDEHIDFLFVFEDDVILSPEASLFIGQKDWLLKRFDAQAAFIIRLETFLMLVKTRETDILPYHQRTFRLLQEIHYGTAGYVISYEAAKSLYEAFARLTVAQLDAIDELMFKRFVDNPLFPTYQLSPAICVQEECLNKERSTLRSQLEGEREIKWKNMELARKQQKLPENHSDKPKLKRTWQEKLIHALTKLSREKEKRRKRKEQMEIEKRLLAHQGMEHEGRQIIHFK